MDSIRSDGFFCSFDRWRVFLIVLSRKLQELSIVTVRYRIDRSSFDFGTVVQNRLAIIIADHYVAPVFVGRGRPGCPAVCDGMLLHQLDAQ